ncbi:MAG: hypothetical protein ACLSHG_08525 [Oscillospiraceae bacterium]
MKKCDCKIMNTLGKYQKIWPWIGVAGYAIDGAEAVLKHTKWGKAHYKLRMLIHGAGAGLLCPARAYTRCRRLQRARRTCPPSSAGRSSAQASSA